MLVSHMGSILGGILKAKNAYKLYIGATELVTVSVEFMLIHEVDFPVGGHTPFYRQKTRIVWNKFLFFNSEICGEARDYLFKYTRHFNIQYRIMGNIISTK